MVSREQKDDLVDTVLDELHAYETLANDQYDRAWKAFRRMTESDLMLMKVILQKYKTKLQEGKDQYQSDILASIKNRMK